MNHSENHPNRFFRQPYKLSILFRYFDSKRQKHPTQTTLASKRCSIIKSPSDLKRTTLIQPTEQNHILYVTRKIQIALYTNIPNMQISNSQFHATTGRRISHEFNSNFHTSLLFFFFFIILFAIYNLPSLTHDL